MRIVIKEKNDYTRLLAIRLAQDLKAEVSFEEVQDPDFILEEKPSAGSAGTEPSSDKEFLPEGLSGQPFRKEETAEEKSAQVSVQAPGVSSISFRRPVTLAYSCYEPASLLLQKIRNIWLCLEGCGQILPTIAVTAAAGGQGVTAAAKQLCSILAEDYEQNVLFLSLDPFEGPEDRVIYELLSGRPDCGAALLFSPQQTADLLRTEPDPDGRRSVFPCSIGQLSFTEMKTLLTSLKNNCEADVLVLDIPAASPHWSLCVRAAECTLIIRRTEAGCNAGRFASTAENLSVQAAFLREKERILTERYNALTAGVGVLVSADVPVTGSREQDAGVLREALEKIIEDCGLLPEMRLRDIRRQL